MFPFLNKDKAVKIRFFLSPETNKKQFTVFDQITFERYQNGQASNERFYILMSHFMVDEKNQFLGEEKAMRVLEKLSTEEAEQTIRQFLEAFQESAVPKANGSGSTLTPIPGQVETLPAGPQP